MPAIKLNAATLSQLPTSIRVPGYDRSKLPKSIVHIGVGGFFRAHQAEYLDDLLGQPGSEGWGYVGVGLLPHDERMRDAMRSQDCLYTLVERGAKGERARIVGSVGSFLHAPENPDAVLEAMTS